MSLRKISLAASAGLGASLLALSAAGPAAAATAAPARVTPAATESFMSVAFSEGEAEGLALVQAEHAGFTASECSAPTAFFLADVWHATVTCTD